MKFSLRLKFLAGIFCLLFSTQILAQSALQDSPPLPEKLRIALLDGKFDSALRTIRDLQKSKPDLTGYWYYLEGITQQRNGKATAAVRAFERVETEFNTGPWVHKARFHHAEVLSDAGDWKGAEQIWESEVSWLRGAERQRELAAIYFELADGFSAQQQGAASLEQAEYRSAIVLYNKGLELDLPAEQRQYALGRVAWCYTQLGEWQAAARMYGLLWKENDDPQTHFEYADALRQQNALEQARREYEDLAAELEEQRGDQELNHLHGLALYSIGYTLSGNRAIGAFRRFLEEHPQHAKSGRAAYGIAMHRLDAGEYDKGLEALQSFLAVTPITDDLEELQHHEDLRQRAYFKIAQTHIQSGRYAEGGAAFARYVSLFPEGPDWAAAQRGIINAEYSLGRYFETEQDWTAARKAYTQFLADHPLDARVREILYRLGDLYGQQAAALEAEGKRSASELTEYYQSSIQEWRRLIAKYPNSNEASRALYSTGFYRELKLDDLEGAVESYRACNFGSFRQRAENRLRDMVKPRLAIHTERVWRSNEAASLELELRNVEQVKVEVYRLDLEAYFRKHLSIRQIEDLDLDLIAADQEFEYAVKEFEPFRPFTQQVELPVEGVGVWAVVVSSKEKRATTLVMRSDLDIMVKSSRESAFIFAEDMLKMKGASGVDLILAVQVADSSDPKMIEVSTGRDGVAQVDFADFDVKSASDVRVFAKDKRGMASTTNWVANVSSSRSLEPSGFVFTDASAYQPGALVSWRAVLRGVEEGLFVFDEGQPWRVTMTDSGGRVVFEETTELSDIGTLFGATRLAAGAPSGLYFVRCESPSGQTHSTAFLVQPFAVKRVELDLEFDRSVYYRGESIDLLVRAKYSYGEPVADAELHVNLPGSQGLRVRTDKNGEFQYSFDSRDTDAIGALRFSAFLPQQNVGADATTLLADTGFRIGITPPQSVYLLGRDIPIDLRTVTPDGAALGQSLELRLVRRYKNARSQWTEEQVSQMTVVTNEEGKYTAQLVPEQGGQHVLFAEGTDRFGNPVAAQVEFMVSGSDDSVKLRLLSNVENVQVGGTMPLEIVNRAGKGLALLTFEGGRILDYQFVMLKEGVQALEVPVPDAFFPDLVVTVNFMHHDDFLFAERGFAVARNLVVTMTPRKAVVHPGELVEIDVQVRNQLGDPVKAELSFAAVDSALFELFPDQSGYILKSFRGHGKRRDSFVTKASNVFSYSGVTRGIAMALLEENKRLRAEEAWEVGKGRAANQLRRDGEYKGPGDTIPPGQSPAAVPMAPGKRFAAPSVEMEVEELGYTNSDEWNSQVGMGGGAGGKYGGRGGRGRKAREGGSMAAVGGSFGLASVAGQALVGQVDEEVLDALTADWQPSIVTDRHGKATIQFTAPQLSTRWSLMCRGVDQGAAVGQVTSSVISRADFLVELRTPAVFLEGDQASVLARAHNLSGLAGDVTLTVEVDYPSGKQVVHSTMHFDGSAVQDVAMVLPNLVPAGFAGDVSVKLSAVGDFLASGEKLSAQATTARPVRVVPWGLAVAEQHSGQLSSSTEFSLQLPEGGSYSAASWSLHLGLGLDQMLVEEALSGSAAYLPSRHVLRRSGPQRNPGFAGELQGILGVLQHLRDSRRSDHAGYRALMSRADGLVTTLLATQQGSGGWAWSSRKTDPRHEVSARAMIALESARAFGLQVPDQALLSGRQYLLNALTARGKQLPFTRAIVLYALSFSDNVDFGLVNSMHRTRNRLSPDAAAYTALTLQRLGSFSMAKDLLEIALRKNPASQTAASFWCSSPVELQSLLLITALHVDPTHSAIEELEQSLMAQRPWYGSGAHGMALAAISAHRTATGLQDRSAQISVSINGGKAQTIRLGKDNTSADLSGLVAQAAGQSAVNIRLKLKGRGKPHFTATLEGFDTQPKENHGNRMSVYRTAFLAAPKIYNGKEFLPGFTTVDHEVSTWRNKITQLDFASSAPMQVILHRSYNDAEDFSRQDFITAEIPLPAGTHVVADSMQGPVESWVERGGRLFVDLGQTRGTSFTIEFRLRGLVPGKYRTLPVTMHSAYDPSIFGVGSFGQLEVMHRDAIANNPFRATPDELYHLGVVEYARNDKDLAWQHLRALDEAFGENLHTRQLLEASRIMLELAIDRNDANRIVKFFEILKEKNPSLTVTFERMAVIAAAYRDLGEYERATRVLAAVAEETFNLDLQVVRVLEEQNDFHGATEVLHRFWLDYPDFPAVVETALTLADRLLMAAPDAYKDRSLRAAHRDRAVLLYESVMLLERFLVLYSDDPIAPDAALNLVSAHLDLEDFERASKLASEFAGRYQDPTFKDAFVYTQAVAEWTIGHDKRSTKLLEGIANAVYTDSSGREHHSENRDLALYILAQIHHAKRDFVQAASYYEKVRTVFADANLVLEGFRRRTLSVDEVTEVAPGDKAKFELHYRNLDQAELLVYPVDLMTLYLREKNLAGITSVNLAGIEPVIRRSVKLPDSGSMRQQDYEVELKLPEAGAYLVICRSESIHASGMILVSDFELEVAMVGEQGVRVQAVGREDGDYLRDVDVRVIGAMDSNFISGRTDPRGLYLADGFEGAVTVIARHGGRHYAFYRGDAASSSELFELQLAPRDKDAKGFMGEMLDSDSYLDNVRSFNGLQQESRSQSLKKKQQSQSLGVELNKLQ
jgi:uncharacterized protein YfaS (alpha-2-macroglobulin family)/TolA-binding protein